MNNEKTRCNYCDVLGNNKCPVCHGDGRIEFGEYMGASGCGWVYIRCPNCGGSGIVRDFSNDNKINIGEVVMEKIRCFKVIHSGYTYYLPVSQENWNLLYNELGIDPINYPDEYKEDEEVCTLEIAYLTQDLLDELPEFDGF